MAWYIFVAKTVKERILHIVALVLVAVLSALFSLVESGTSAIGKGILQRAMYK